MVRIALYLYDPHLNNLKGENCGPVSQTRVCEPPNKGDSSTRTAPELTRSRSEECTAQVSPLGLAGRIQLPNVSDLPPTRSTLAPPLTGLTCGLQVIEGLHRAGVELRGPCRRTSTRPRPPTGSSSRWCSPSASGGGTRPRSARSRARRRLGSRGASLTGGRASPSSNGSTSGRSGRRE